MKEVVLLLMTGGPRTTAVERVVTEACDAATADTVQRALAARSISRIVVATDSQALASSLERQPVTIDVDETGDRFHFGRRLVGLIERYQIERVLYMGGGSGVLLTADDLDRLGRMLAEADRLVVVNNFFSTDFAGWTPAKCLSDLLLPKFDNELGWMLGDVAGLPVVALERSAATQFDIDTPTDLLTVTVHPAVGAHLRGHLNALSLDTGRLDRALRCFSDSRAEVVIFGRAGAAVWAFLEAETDCRIRMLSEERGMRADGRLFRAEARSLLGYYMEQVGLRAGFSRLAELGDAAFVDSRVLWAHFARWPSPGDRFLSDLGRVDEIQDPWLREFTAGALDAPIPIVLGGHSLVAGGLYAVVEAAVAGYRLRGDRRATPSPSRLGFLDLA